jgi:hypothetical protein
MYNYYKKEKLFSLVKSEDEEIHFSVTEKRGKLFCDIRIYHIQEDGSKAATHKGIFISGDQLSEFKQGCDRLIEAKERKAV